MTRTLLVLAAFFVLAVPTAFAVPPADKGKPESPGKSAAAPGQSEDKNAAKKCKAERTRLGVEEFRKKYASPNHPNGANAFGKCVSAQQKKAEDAEEAAEEAKENAAKKCAKERSDLGVEEFRKKYGTPNHPNGANAFGKCVSKHAKKATTT